MAVAVVTDTTQYGPPELLAEQQIGVVSLYVNEGDTQARESDLSDVGTFFERLRDAAALPTTSQPSIGDFLAVYEPLALAGHDIVSVHISADLSGTAEAARQAAQQLMSAHTERRVEVVDSRSACGGLALIVLAGAAAARGGADIDAVVNRIHEAQRTTRIWFAIDTLEYLHRGGRVGGAQAWLGGALKIKPILTVDGEITPVERVRTSGRAFERMVGYMDERKADGADRLGGAAHPGAGAGGEARPARARDLRLRAGAGLRDRTGHRRPRRAGPARRRGDPAGAAAVLSRQRRRRRPNSPPMAAIPPPITNPATAAPIIASRWWRPSCLRQSVSSATSPRSFDIECASSTRLDSIDARISAGVRGAELLGWDDI